MCPVCEDSGIEIVKVEMPDGYGGYDAVEETRPCSACS